MAAKSRMAAMVTAAWPDWERMINPRPAMVARAKSVRWDSLGSLRKRMMPQRYALQRITQGASELDMADGSGKIPKGRWVYLAMVIALSWTLRNEGLTYSPGMGNSPAEKL